MTQVETPPEIQALADRLLDELKPGMDIGAELEYIMENHGQNEDNRDRITFLIAEVTEFNGKVEKILDDYQAEFYKLGYAYELGDEVMSLNIYKLPERKKYEQ